MNLKQLADQCGTSLFTATTKYTTGFAPMQLKQNAIPSKADSLHNDTGYS